MLNVEESSQVDDQALAINIACCLRLYRIYQCTMHLIFLLVAFVDVVEIILSSYKIISFAIAGYHS